MKTIYMILIAVFMTASFAACTADSIADNDEISPEQVATDGQDGHVEEEDQGGN